MRTQHILLFMEAIVQGMLHRLSSHLPMDIAPDPTIGRLLITGMPPLTDPIMVIVMGIESDIAVNL